MIRFALMGYATKDIALTEGLQYNIQLVEKATQLKEVTVKAEGIRMKGDTISYLVSKFAKTQDKTIADVMKNMPGIEVDREGTIKYNGKPINKFYIEGKDMLEGRYGLATNNIHQQDVGTVEVMENHQPIKALENISFSQNPAINIRLKEAAKARWVGNAKLGAGFSPFLWNSQLFTMRFTPKTQSLDTYKTNNTGQDLTSETRTLSFQDISGSFSDNYRLNNYISIGSNFIPQIDNRRSLFNKSHLVSTNNLWSLNKNFDITSQISYLNNRTENNSQSETQYFLNDGTVTSVADEHGNEKQNQLLADITLKSNTSNHYIENKLSTDIRWDNLNNGISGTYPNNQMAKLPYRKVSDNIEVIKRFGKKIYTFYSYNMYQQKPQHLTVERTANIQQQNVSSSAFFTHTHTSLAFIFKPITISMKVGIIGTFRDMKSNLSGIPDSIGTMANDLSMNFLHLYASPEIELNTSSLKMYLRLPISYLPYYYHDRLTESKEHADKLYASPSLTLNYFITPQLSVSAIGSIHQTAVNEQLFYSGLLMSNYRNLYLGYVDFHTGHSSSTSLDLAYRNPLKSFFSRFGFGYYWHYSPLSSSRQFIGDYILNSYLNRDNWFHDWSVNGRISKGFEWLNTIFILNSDYHKTTASIYQNDVKTNYVSTEWNINPRITMSLARWCNIGYELNYNKNKLLMKDTSKETKLKNLSQKASATFSPSKTCYFKLICEHYYNEITTDVNKSLVLADADFTYCLKSGWELNLAVTNIFNQRHYSYRAYSGTMSLYESYKIRPRNVIASVYFRF